MGKSLNRATLIGRLGRDPEVKYLANGTPFCRFSIATDESWTDKNSGEKQERVEWHNVTAWNKLAEICGQYLKKGRQVYVEGSLQTREWEDDSGVKRKSTEIRLTEMTMLGERQDSPRPAPPAGRSYAPTGNPNAGRGEAYEAPRSGGGPAGYSDSPITDADIPFIVSYIDGHI